MRWLLILLLLNACNGGGLLKGSGVPIDAPYGYTVGCQNNPDAVACP